MKAMNIINNQPVEPGNYHTPVLLKEAIDGLNIKPGWDLCGLHFWRWRTFKGNPATAGRRWKTGCF